VTRPAPNAALPVPGLLALAAALVLASGPAGAGQPWAEAGDRQLRQDVETLKAARLIRGPVNHWPLPWSQIEEGVRAAQSRPVAPHIAAAARRLDRLIELAAQRRTVEIRAAATNHPALIRGFGTAARERGDVAVQITRSLGRLAISGGIGWREGQDGRDIHIEPAQATLGLGNWVLYGGHVQKWWGAGQDGALHISNNARPFPKLGVQRLYPYPPEPRLLRWIGPWRFDAFGGVMDDRRRDSDRPLQFGTAFSFEPLPGLEFNLHRLLWICGGTRAGENPTLGGVCTAGSVVRGIIPLFPGVKPGDSLAGIALSYSGMVGPVAVRLHYDVAGEDKDSFQQFDQVGQVGGATLTGPLGEAGATWQLGAEYANTVARFWFTGREVPGSFYNNFFYFDGKVYRGDAVGHAIDGDSTLLSVHGAITDSANRRWHASVRAADIYRTEAPNAAGEAANRLSSNRERIDILTAGVEWPTRLGDITVEGRWQSDSPDTPGETRPRSAVELGWRSRF
jgi:hypothetical protein